MEIEQHWAVMFPSVLEKEAFFNTILGKTVVYQGQVTFPFASQYQKQKIASKEVNSYRDLIAHVSQRYTFTNKDNLQNFYFQQRFNATESDTAFSVKEHLTSIKPKRSGYWNIESVLEVFDLIKLQNESLLKLSNGETRRLAIASALLHNPMLFLMDEPLTGLDRETRRLFDHVFQQIANSGIQLILATKFQEIPNIVTHVGIYGTNGMQSMSKSTFLKNKKMDQLDCSNEINGKKLDELFVCPDIPKYEKFVKLNNVNVIYGEKCILKNVSWEIKQGESWSIKGHNGAGKSTLISLLIGEHPQAYANEIYLFDKKRGTGESIWDIKKPIGFVSSDLSRFFPRNQTCKKVILSGFFDTMGLFKKTSAEQDHLAMNWMEFLRIEKYSNVLFHQSPIDIQRFCLLARALVKSPVFLILDEATQGMDENQASLFRQIVNYIGKRPLISILYVSHYDHDIPSIIEKELVLQAGEVFQINGYSIDTP
ncbi:ATP-binding cassette domain-containing protein [Belliella kenyensis]|nr:ATP-binding cassette domain-containing protein [Belliella kenyensis]MCH7403012.1 ATP-binding cassette domain-containing protein [Belliella kenyensis]MDN3605048.1 ATP-binding cassette domain-containing protein [Belliella kenyensis]